MATAQMSAILHHLHRVVRGDAEQMDGELLGAFVCRRDDAALAMLVERHAPMVWGVCRRLLHNHHDAEDAFQATFLVLVRKAASIRSADLLANWLYGVAHQTAVRARAVAARRGTRERQVPEMPEPAAVERDVWRDLRPLLDQELSCLPDKYRRLIVLCDLAGKTRKEVAEQLGCPEGTVAGQLFRAREMLARRLARHGLAVTGAVLGVILSAEAVSAAPAVLISSTIQAASLSAAGQATAGAVSPGAVALTEGVLKAMLVTKLKLTAVFAVAVCAVALGGGALHQALAAAPGGDVLRVPGQDRKKATEPKDESLVRGTLASVDADKNTVTITSRAFDRKTGESTESNKTYAVAKDAKIVQDESAVKLADLKKGFPAVLKLDGTTAVSVSVEGGTGQAEFRSFNAERNTIVVIAGRDMARRVVHLLKETKVLGEDGKPIRVQDLKSGTKIQITRSIEDDNTAVRIQIQTATEPKKRER